MKTPYGLSWLFRRVWQRNLTVYRKSWHINFLPPLLEPLFYLLAFGVGLSSLVGSVRYNGTEVSYINFITPAIIAISIMNNAFFENTYASFVRMYYQKTFDAMMATPLSLEEVITGEIIWGATKSLIATIIMLTVISLFGLITYPSGLLLIPIAFFGGLAFGSLGMYFTGIVKNIEHFNIPAFLFYTPMFLFSGTFFPLESLPRWAELLALTLPLTHLVRVCRALGWNMYDTSLLWGLAYLVVFCLIFFPLAISRMRWRLLK
jgi:lipooligosaccharide transport system permease protein